MGADIYLNSIFEKRKAEKPNDFDYRYDDVCYFRDSYNGTSLYWLLGRSWWKDVQELFPSDVYDDEGEFKKSELSSLLEKQRNYTFEMEKYVDSFDELFDEWWNKPDKHITIDDDSNNRSAWKEYMQKKLDNWIALLHRADDLGEVLYWSV